MNPEPVPAIRGGPPLRLVDDFEPPIDALGAASAAFDPALTIQTCANCGATMIERKCKLICTCGYFLSCSDYY